MSGRFAATVVTSAWLTVPRSVITRIARVTLHQLNANQLPALAPCFGAQLSAVTALWPIGLQSRELESDL